MIESLYDNLTGDQYEYNTEIKEREEEQKQHMKHMSMIFEWELSVIAFNSHFSVL